MLIHLILIHVLRLPSLRRHYSRDLVPSNRCHHHLLEIMIPELMSLFVRLWDMNAQRQCRKLDSQLDNLIKKTSLKKIYLLMNMCNYMILREYSKNKIENICGFFYFVYFVSNYGCKRRRAISTSYSILNLFASLEHRPRSWIKNNIISRGKANITFGEPDENQCKREN